MVSFIIARRAPPVEPILPSPVKASKPGSTRTVQSFFPEKEPCLFSTENLVCALRQECASGTTTMVGFKTATEFTFADTGLPSWRVTANRSASHDTAMAVLHDMSKPGAKAGKGCFFGLIWFNLA